MAKKATLAVTGVGKTYHICHEMDPTKKKLILARKALIFGIDNSTQPCFASIMTY